MLIDRGVTAGEVITLKLTSGEDLVKPSVIGMSPKGPALMPYLFTVSPEKDIKLSKTAVAVVAASDKEFADQYMQGTTGIAMA